MIETSFIVKHHPVNKISSLPELSELTNNPEMAYSRDPSGLTQNGKRTDCKIARRLMSTCPRSQIVR